MLEKSLIKIFKCFKIFYHSNVISFGFHLSHERHGIKKIRRKLPPDNAKMFLKSLIKSFASLKYFIIKCFKKLKKVVKKFGLNINFLVICCFIKI